MNKHELKFLLENIYHLLAEEGEWHAPLLAPPDPYPIPMAPPPPWLSPLSPTAPVAPPVYNDPWDDPISPGYGQNIRELLRNRGFPDGLNPPEGGTIQDWMDWFRGLSAIDRGRLALWWSTLDLSEAGQEIFKQLQGLMVPDKFGNYPMIYGLEAILRFLMANPEYWNS